MMFSRCIEPRWAPLRRHSHRPWARRVAIGLTVTAVTILALACTAHGKPCTASNSCQHGWALSSGGSIRYYRSLPIRPSDAIRSVVIVIHGRRRDAGRYFERLVQAAAAESRLGDTLLLAPQFGTAEDRLARNDHYWSSAGWKTGDESRDGRAVSSFSVMDELLAHICPKDGRRFPELKRVVLVGHSAGGQFVNRYLAAGQSCPDPVVDVRYVVMNPSSYLYVDGRRWVETVRGFAVPEPGCDQYDDYRYGLNELNAYLKGVGVERIRVNLFERQSFYLVGDTDRGAGPSLDTTCAGRLQGANRFERHQHYRRYQNLFPHWTGSEFVIVPGVGHDGGNMLMSEEARRILFQ